jgi:hypothetical protein
LLKIIRVKNLILTKEKGEKGDRLEWHLLKQNPKKIKWNKTGFQKVSSTNEIPKKASK